MISLFFIEYNARNKQKQQLSTASITCGIWDGPMATSLDILVELLITFKFQVNQITIAIPFFIAL